MKIKCGDGRVIDTEKLNDMDALAMETTMKYDEEMVKYGLQYILTVKLSSGCFKIHYLKENE